MPRRKGILNSSPEDFELRRKNPIELGLDSNLDKDLKPLRIGGIPTNLEFSLGVGEDIAKASISGGLDFDLITTNFLKTPIIFATADKIDFQIYDADAFQINYNSANPEIKLRSVIDANDWFQIESFNYDGSVRMQTVEGASDTGVSAKMLFLSNREISFTAGKNSSSYGLAADYITFNTGNGIFGQMIMSVEDEWNLRAEDNLKLEE